MTDTVTPVVSVVMSFYNSGAFIADAIQSLVGQSLQEWELLLVDDGSGDSDSAIARAWAERLPSKIRYFEHPGHANRGEGASRNRGIVNARGRYIAFLDADDVYLPHRLAQHVEILERLPGVDMVQSDQAYWYWWRDRAGTVRQEVCLRPPLLFGDSVIRPPDGLSMLFGVPDYFVGTCSMTLRRSAVMAVGAFEDGYRSLYQDQVFLTKVYASRTVYWQPSCLAWYRLHSGGALATAVAGRLTARDTVRQAALRLREWQAQYLAERVGQHPVVGYLLVEQLEAARDGRRAWMALQAQRLRRALHAGARLCLPVAWYQALLRRRQAQAARRARAHHRDLCRRISGMRFRQRQQTWQ